MKIDSIFENNKDSQMQFLLFNVGFYFITYTVKLMKYVY